VRKIGMSIKHGINSSQLATAKSGLHIGEKSLVKLNRRALCHTAPRVSKENSFCRHSFPHLICSFPGRDNTSVYHPWFHF